MRDFQPPPPFNHSFLLISPPTSNYSELDLANNVLSTTSGEAAEWASRSRLELMGEIQEKDKSISNVSANSTCDSHDQSLHVCSADVGPELCGTVTWLPFPLKRVKQERSFFTVKLPQKLTACTLLPNKTHGD